MRQFEQLDLMLTDQDGMLQISQATAVGISKSVFYDYVKTRELERVAPGIYLSKDSWVDAMYLIHLRLNKLYFLMRLLCFFIILRIVNRRNMKLR